MGRFDDETFKNLSNVFTDSGFLYGTDKTARYLHLINIYRQLFLKKEQKSLPILTLKKFKILKD